jgi:hypothetical protein
MFYCFARDTLDGLQSRIVRTGIIIDTDHLVSVLDQIYDCVRANVATATGNDNF